MKYILTLIFINTIISCSGQQVNFKQIIYDKSIDTSLFITLTENELRAIEAQKYRHDKDSSGDTDFEGNRAKLNIESIWDNETVKEEHINEKPASCDCFYDKDTLFIQINCYGGGGFGLTGQEGLGFDIKIIGNEFNSNFFQWNTLHKMYKDIEDDSIRAYVIAKNIFQELKFKKKINFKKSEIIYGVLKYKTDTIFMTNEKILKEPYHDPGDPTSLKQETYISQGEIIFKCDKFKKRDIEIKKKSWEWKGKRTMLKLKAPYHIFDPMTPIEY